MADYDNWDFMPSPNDDSSGGFDNWNLMPSPNAGGGQFDYGYGPGETPGNSSPPDPNRFTDSPGPGESVNGPGGGYTGVGGGGADWLKQVLKLLGVTGKSGDVNSTGILSLLSALGAGVGGVMSNNATKTATNQVLAGYDKANTDINRILGGASAAYDPYKALGASASAALPGLQYKGSGPMAPIQGASSFVRSSAGQAPQQQSQGMTLAQLMGRK